MRIQLPASLLIVGLLLVPRIAAQTEGSGALKEWIDGPVRYILRAAEAKAFRALKTDGEREAFIERFWLQRDPTPETLANEYRQMFWERVRDANERFLDSTKPGWKTDRGKIFILYGPPTDIEEDLNANVAGLRGVNRGLIRWIYQGRPGGRRDMEPVVVVPFVRDTSGEWYISKDPELSSVFFDAQGLNERRAGTWDSFTSEKVLVGRSELAVMLDLGKMQEVPTQEESLIERITTTESYGAVPLRVRVDRYEPPSYPETLVSVTVDLPGTRSMAVPAILARFVPRDATKVLRTLGEGSFAVEDREPQRVAQARLQLPPGTWDLTVIVADPVELTTGVYTGSIEVGTPTPRLHVSDLALARRLEPLPYATLAGYDEPFVVGTFRVIPRTRAVLAPGEAVRLFYQIYGGRPPYRVTYRLEGQEADATWTPLVPAIVREAAEAAQGWELPTSTRWPLGLYRVQVDVEDTAGERISVSLPFALEPPREPPPRP